MPQGSLLYGGNVCHDLCRTLWEPEDKSPFIARARGALQLHIRSMYDSAADMYGDALQHPCSVSLTDYFEQLRALALAQQPLPPLDGDCVPNHVNELLVLMQQASPNAT